MERARDLMRSGGWLTRERIRLVAAAILVASSIGLLVLVLTAHGGIDAQGRPLGTDFANVYAAGTFVDDGQPEAPFDLARQYAREQAIFGKATPFYGWHYPPYFLFVASALARLPYGLALTAWQVVTLFLYFLTMRAIVEPSFGEEHSAGLGSAADWLLLTFAFPAVLINIGHGQNGFLTAALLGGALAVLDRRPIVAGILFGLLIYKPQYGLLIPVALAAGGYWRSFAAAAAAVVVLTLATTLAFGPHVWSAFLDSTHFARTVALEQGDTGWHKIQSVFSWARMWGAPIPLAYVLQGAVIVAAGTALAWLWRSPAPYPLKAATLCLAAILATPYTFDYDMMVLAPAIAFFAVDGLARGFGPWEKTALGVLWLVPLVARSVAQISLIPLGVPAMLLVFVLILRRAELGLSLPVGFGTTPPALVREPHGTSGNNESG